MGEMAQHEARVEAVRAAGAALRAAGHFAADDIAARLHQLHTQWTQLQEKALQVHIFLYIQLAGYIAFIGHTTKLERINWQTDVNGLDFVDFSKCGYYIYLASNFEVIFMEALLNENIRFSKIETNLTITKPYNKILIIKA